MWMIPYTPPRHRKRRPCDVSYTITPKYWMFSPLISTLQVTVEALLSQYGVLNRNSVCMTQQKKFPLIFFYTIKSNTKRRKERIFEKAMTRIMNIKHQKFGTNTFIWRNLWKSINPKCRPYLTSEDCVLYLLKRWTSMYEYTKLHESGEKYSCHHLCLAPLSTISIMTTDVHNAKKGPDYFPSSISFWWH